MRLTLFLLGQCAFLGGAWWTLTRLRATKNLVTAWGFTILAWFLYLLIWYGPTSVFVVLGKEYVKEVATHPWWLREDMLVPALLNTIVLQLLPIILTVLLLRRWKHSRFGPWMRLEPLLGHVSVLWFGILGTFCQALTAFLWGHIWLQSQFDFSILPLWQKAAASGFFMFTIGPQLAFLAYRYWRPNIGLSEKRLNFLTLLSIVVAIYSFAAFGQRTYVMFEACLLVFILDQILPVLRRALVIVLPTLIFTAYGLTSLQARIQPGSSFSVTLSLIGQRLVDDLAYRSGIANDSVVLGARTCVLQQLEAEGKQPFDLLTMEVVSGLPAPLRLSIYPLIGEQRLEPRVGQCYRDWLREPSLRPDLSDSKIEYFLAVLPPFMAGVIGGTIWLLTGMLFLAFLAYLFDIGLESIAFFVPASAHLLVLSTTPGEFLVLLKAGLPYLAVFLFLEMIRTRKTSF